MADVTELRENVLAAYLRERAAMDFAWGTNDCAFFLADWLMRLGIDVGAAPFRGTYTDEAGADRACGGPRAAFFAMRAALAGLPPTDDPALGDVGLLDLPGLGLVGGIRTQVRWAVLGDGIVLLPASRVAVAAAWSTSHRQAGA